MGRKILVYWIGIIGIPGKGPAYIETFVPNRSIGELIKSMSDAGIGERNRRIEMLKHKPGDISKYDIHNPYWNHNTKLSEYVNQMGGANNTYDIQMVFCLV